MAIPTRTGDVIIEIKSDMTPCVMSIVLDDGDQRGHDPQTVVDGKKAAIEQAAKHVATTGGRIFLVEVEDRDNWHEVVPKR